MPGRDIPLVSNEVYHVINRGIASQPVFLNKRDYARAQETIFYYQNQEVPLRYSFFLRLPIKQKADFLDRIKAKKNFLVEIIAFCLMPSHFHLLLKQVQENGISTFVGNFTNSYTRYFNTKQKRVGPLFQGKFKAVRVENDEQLVHLSRYIHLNPYSSYLLKNLRALESYPFSSFLEYLNPTKSSYCQKELVLGQFKSLADYEKFVFNQVDYQRKLEQIKHLLLEDNPEV